MPPKTTTAEDDTPEWKTLNFRFKVMNIVRSSGDHLKKDGSNYREWEYRIRDLVDDWIEPGWLDREDAHVTDPKGDRIVLMMIKYSLEIDVAMKISKVQSAAEAMRMIKALFYFPSRSKQVACLRNILAVRLDDNDDINTYLRAMALPSQRTRWSLSAANWHYQPDTPR
ncbi:hypothetical protein CROQUDRAFT_650436 [Cronartium quercuum f. sp. fusiforme G11]|uniref:Uncharacterized protein n=1 Tax=Cronartium quercuum f. sp. fusiforme G11 TaxID=708437 RepID=A0A9P6NR69_9BASI|nr:hypothetical protein CROQUDRAFT_650436 [Cronartium quercuum f. sp. fusiforme G11]